MDFNEANKNCDCINAITESSCNIASKNILRAKVRADIIEKEPDYIDLWGIVKDCNKDPIPNVVITLYKEVFENNGSCNSYYKEIGKTISDCKGYYYFDIDRKDVSKNYKLVANKKNTCFERLVNISFTHKKCKNEFKDSGCKNYCCKEELRKCCNDNYIEEKEYTCCELCKTCKFYDEESGRCLLN